MNKINVNNIKVSIIIPTYQRSTTLQEALKSAINQTYKNIEIIIVDDNDPKTIYRKKTEEIMKQYLNDNRINYIKHKQNLNGAAARNTGIKNCTGQLITFLDDDDLYAENKVEAQLNFLLTNKKYDGVYCGSIIKGQKKMPYSYGNLSKDILLKEAMLYTPTLMFNKDAILDIDGFNENFNRHQDYEFLLRYFKKYEIGVISDCLVFIGDNIGENSLFGIKLNENKNFFLKMFNESISEIDKKNSGYKKQVISKHYVDVFFRHLRTFYFILAIKILFKYGFYSPINFVKYGFLKIKDYINYYNYVKGY